MHALVAMANLAGLVAAYQPYYHPSMAFSDAFTLVANVTDPETHLPIHGLSLTTIHIGAGQALPVLTDRRGRVWYVNGTGDESEGDNDTSLVTDSGTPLFPNGLTVDLAEDSVSDVLVSAGPGTLGIGISNHGPPTYLTGPAIGSYLVCKEAVPYYKGKKFLVLKYSEWTEDEHGDLHTNSRQNCAEVTLLPQCADLPELPDDDAVSSHDFVLDVLCFTDVSSIDWSFYNDASDTDQTGKEEPEDEYLVEVTEEEGIVVQSWSSAMTLVAVVTSTD